jgi:anti-sigma factor RsiW
MIMCTYSEDRGETLLAYLYDELEPRERVQFESHLASCPECIDELAELRAVRSQLGRWAPPEPGPLVRPDRARPEDPRWWQQVPIWAQTAAALLVFGVAAAIANLEVRVDASGVTVRTGWSAPAGAPADLGVAPTAANPPGAAPVAEPWRTELAALEDRLRNELRAAAPASSEPRTIGADDGDAVLLRRMRGIVDESERRQQRELALRLAGVIRDVDAQRRADLVRIDRSLGTIERNTGVEVMRQRETLNYLVRTAQGR